MSDLLPCPFCGGQAEFNRHEAYSVDSSFDCIRCVECGVMMEYEDARWDYLKKEWNHDDRVLTIAAWNRRADLPRPQDAARIAELEAALRDVIEAWDWWRVDQYDRCQSVPADAIHAARAALGLSQVDPGIKTASLAEIRRMKNRGELLTKPDAPEKDDVDE